MKSTDRNEILKDIKPIDKFLRIKVPVMLIIAGS
jgi:hypothetical protein